MKSVRRIASVCFILHCDFFPFQGQVVSGRIAEPSCMSFHPPQRQHDSYQSPTAMPHMCHQDGSMLPTLLGSIEEACHSIPFGERQLHWDSPKGGSILGQVGLGCMLYQPYRKGTNPPCDTGSNHLVIASWLLYPQTDQLPLHILSFTAWAMQMHLPSLSLFLSVLVWVPIMLHECSCGDEQTFLHSK